MAGFTESRIINGEYAYKVFRQIFLTDEGSYGREIAEDIESNENEVSRCISTLKSMDLIKKGKRSKAQYYTDNKEGLKTFFESYYSVEVEEEWFTDFLYKYCENYLTENEVSTIDEMIGQRFFDGLVSFTQYSDEAGEEINEIRELLLEDADLSKVSLASINHIMAAYFD